MKIEYDLSKRQWTLENRGLDFDRVSEIFSGLYLTRIDDRSDYGEVRNIVLGALDDVPVVLVWSPRGGARRIISLRKANAKERKIYKAELDRSG